jgi:hypothetical protein
MASAPEKARQRISRLKGIETVLTSQAHKIPEEESGSLNRIHNRFLPRMPIVCIFSICDSLEGAWTSSTWAHSTETNSDQ